MSRLLKNHSIKRGLKPGTAVFVGEKKLDKLRIRVIDYNANDLNEYEFESVEECFPFRDTENISWINIDGLHDVESIQKICQHFNIEELIIEDIVNTGQRPKLELENSTGFVIMKMLYLKNNHKRIHSEQISFIFGKNFVISFQERVGDVFEMVRNRLRKTIPRVRFIHSDYLVYTLIDSIVDHYFVVLEEIANVIEDMEDALVKEPQQDDLETIHDLKRQLIYMRKATWPLREVIGGFERNDSELIDDITKPYIRDLYEHTIHVIDTIETFRDMVSGLLDIYISSVSNKMNEVMKVLTIIATIFIPLGFLAGVYGMNFDTSISSLNMPELGLPFGYILFWGLVLIIGGGLVVYFKKKKWL